LKYTLADLPVKVGDLYRATLSAVKINPTGRTQARSAECVIIPENLVKDLQIKADMYVEITIKRIADGLKDGPWLGIVRAYESKLFYVPFPGGGGKFNRGDKVYLRMQIFDIAAWFDSKVSMGLIDVTPAELAVQDKEIVPEVGGADMISAVEPPPAADIAKDVAAAPIAQPPAPIERKRSGLKAEVYEYILNNPGSGSAEIAANLNCSSTYICSIIKVLSEGNKIEKTEKSTAFRSLWRAVA